MRTIETKLFTFDELSKEAKETAIENVRKTYYDYNDFAEWAIDDCWLLNPPHKEIEKYDLEDGILIGNNRKDIYFSTDRNWFLDCTKAMEIKDDKAFYDWLEISRELAENIEYEIYTSNGRNADTEIEFSHIEQEDFTSEQEDVLGQAANKFSRHINDCLKSIEASIDYRYTDESILEDIEANEREFEEDGSIF